MYAMETETEVRRKVLVIDDELGPRESLRILLKEKFDIFLADSVDAGLELLKRERPDVIVLDIRMPGKNGIEGLKDIRDLDKDVSVVMLTGFGALETAQQAMRHGANDYIKKPFDTIEMMSVVERYAQRTDAERRRVRMAEELRSLNSELVSELEEKEQLASLGHASSEIVHDLRNPLTVVQGYAQLLSDQLEGIKDKLGEDSQEALEYLDIMERNIARCNEITETWRNIGDRDLSRRKHLFLDDLVANVVKDTATLARNAGATVHHAAGSNRCKVLIDELQIYRALQNLVTNALQAMPERAGEVRIETQADEKAVVIRVCDNGCGISEEQREKIFQPYFTTKGQAGGTGLGLAITKRVIEQHDGTIEVESSPGQGTTFTLRLPVPASADA